MNNLTFAAGVLGLTCALSPAAADTEWFARARLTPEAELKLGVESETLHFSLDSGDGAKAYKVAVVRFDSGSKVYEADGPGGRLILTDVRGTDGEPGWRLSVLEGPFPLKESARFTASKIDDKNLKASGTQSFDLVVWLKQPLSPRDVRLAVYPLLLDSVESLPVNPARPKAYQLRIVSDLPLAQVIAQLKVIDVVGEVAPVVPTL